MAGVPKAVCKDMMELYIVRISPPSRAVWIYMLQHDLPHVIKDVDYASGEETKPDFIAKNPHQEVPVLVDGDVVVFEGQAILRYLATQYTCDAGYGKTLNDRMLCESIISWANGELHRVVGYRYTYPQFLERFRLSSAQANEVLVESGIRQISRHLEVLETRYLNKHSFLCGNEITIADTFVATVLVQVEWTSFNFKIWPKVNEWLRKVKGQLFWDKVHTAHENFRQEIQNTALATV